MSLLSPGFLLAGALLAAIPLVIHFLNRRRFREQQWAAMDFLLRALKKNRKRLRFEQWLLLAVRCLLLGLLGLALARPLGCGGDALSGLARQSGLHVIVLDDSYSMGFEGTASGAEPAASSAGTHFERAKAVALASLDRLTPGGDAVAVVAAGAPARLVFSAGYDLDAAKSAVGRMELSARSTDLTGALRLASGIAQELQTQPLRQLRIISDGTRSSLEVGGGGEALKQVASDAARQFTKVAFHHLGGGDQRHAAVLDVFPRSALLTVRQPQELASMVQAFGGDESRTAQWALDDVVLPGGGEVRVEQAGGELVLGGVRLDRAGARVLSMRLAGSDRLGIDTVRRRVIDVADRARVLVVEGERGGGVLSSSGAFLNVALAPTSSAGGPGSGGASASNSPLEPESVSDLELPGKVLAEYRVVILAGVGQLAEGTAEQLKAFVEQGGVLIVFAGEPVSMENYNRVLLPRGLLPGALVKRVTAGTELGAGSSGIRFDFRPTGNLHPMLAILRGEERSGLDTAQVYTYLQVELSGTGGPNRAERVLNFTGSGGDTGPARPAGESNSATGLGDPAITTHPLGRGRVVFVATSAGADGWTALPGKPVFVTLVQEMIATSVAPAGDWMNVLVGSRLELPVGLRLTAAPALTDQAGRTFTVAAEATDDGRTVWRSEVLLRPGVYRLSGVAEVSRGASDTGRADTDGPVAGLSLPVVVNVDARAEADIRTVDEAGLRAALGGLDIQFLRDQLPEETSGQDAQSADFGWAVMLVVLCFIGFESLMAMRFGHRNG